MELSEHEVNLVTRAGLVEQAPRGALLVEQDEGLCLQILQQYALAPREPMLGMADQHVAPREERDALEARRQEGEGDEREVDAVESEPIEFRAPDTMPLLSPAVREFVSPADWSGCKLT